MSKRPPRPAARRGAARPRPRRAASRTSRRKRFKTFLTLSLLSMLTLLAIGMAVFLGVFWKFSGDLPGIEAVTADIKAPVPTTIVSEDGVVLGQLAVENRQPISLNDVPKDVINATVAIEDHRFYEHPGIDVQGIARAAVANLRGARLSQGASTLTQQLVRQPDLAAQFGLTTEKKYSRKVREALIALRVEQVYSKREILQLYLNNVYYGAGAYGIQAASLTYFGKSASKLLLGEAALLAGLPQRPSSYILFDHMKAALRRRDDVLAAMRTYGYLTDSQVEAARSATPRLAERPDRKSAEFKAPYFCTYVLEDLRKRYGSDLMYRGLRIETTLNWKIQQMAEKALEHGIERAGQGANQGAIVSIDNKTGYIRALVGGRNYRASKYNAVTQGRRQPGSTFKAFVYSAAFDTDAYNLNSVFSDTYFAYPGDPQHRGVDGESNRPITLLSAIKYSRNSVAVQVANKIGIRTVIDYAHRMGITTTLAPYLPTAIGASAVRPLDLCSAYSIFPMNGNRCLPMSIVRVTDASGNVLEENVPDIKTNILQEETVAQMDKAFDAVVSPGGTGAAARGNDSNGIVENARGKTGTTNDNRDVWFAGYTPELTTVIWVASVVRKGSRYTYREMPGAFGGSVCAPIWHDFTLTAAPEDHKFRLVAQEAQPEPGIDVPKPSADAKPRRRRRRRAGIPPPEADGAPPSADSADSADPTAVTEPPASGDPGTGETAQPVEPPAPRAGDTGAAVPSRDPPRAAAPSARDDGGSLISVRVCVESGDLATRWCNETKTVRVSPARIARMRRCRLHGPPPGEQ